MSEAVEVSIILRIEGGTADEGVLDIYDASDTLYGVARAVNMVAHSFANDQEIRKRADAANGAKAFVHSSLKGCFEEKIDIVFDGCVVQEKGESVIRAKFVDYLTWCWSAAIGVEYQPTTPYVSRLAESDDQEDVFIDEMADALESPMQKMHKAISVDSNVCISFLRPRVEVPFVTLDFDSYSYVATRTISSEIQEIYANVTRFNTLSKFGRLYSDEDARVISYVFDMDEHSEEVQRDAKEKMLWSMQDTNRGGDGKLILRVLKIESAVGIVKRYVVRDVKYR